MKSIKREDITLRQLRLMVHTISDAKRNWFGTHNSSLDAREFNVLVGSGFATRNKAPKWSGDDVIYCLTNKGKEVVRSRP